MTKELVRVGRGWAFRPAMYKSGNWEVEWSEWEVRRSLRWARVTSFSFYGKQADTLRSSNTLLYSRIDPPKSIIPTNTYCENPCRFSSLLDQSHRTCCVGSYAEGV